jgi:hypothetical protein
MLVIPAPCWSQFKEPVLTEFTSGGDLEWGATFSSDMLEVYWVADQVRDTVSAWDIWGARRESLDAPWGEAELVDIINTSQVESSPYLSSDGLTLTFASNGRQGGYGGLDIWQTTRASRDDPWHEPVNMGPTINTRGNEGNATFSRDGLELLFNNGCDGLCSPTILKRSTRESLADEWTTPELLTRSKRGDQIGSVGQPSLSPDGLSLYFNYPGSFGDWDVFVSKRPSLDGLFGPGENLGAPISTSARDTGVRIAPDGSLYYSRWSGTMRIWRAEAEPLADLLGDFDNNGVLDIADIDDLMVRVAAGDDPLGYDLNHDAMVNTEDLHIWVKDLAHTWIGDANLDGEFNSGDLITALAAGTYESDVDAGWSSGDFDGSGRFNSSDLIVALADGGYEQGLRVAAVSAVPEPACSALLALGAIGMCRLRKRRACLVC